MKLRRLSIFVGSLLCFIFFRHVPGVAQQNLRIKQEVERTIHASEMPQEAMELLQPLLNKADRVKYYQEQQNEQTTYEAKFNLQEKKLSVEFTEEGRLIDIEQLIPFEEIEKGSRTKINDYFRSAFRQHRFLRIQRQYAAEESGEAGREVIEQFLATEGEELRIRYEIEAEVKNQDKFGPYEFIFDRKGRMLKEREIIRRSADNILY